MTISTVEAIQTICCSKIDMTEKNTVVESITRSLMSLNLLVLHGSTAFEFENRLFLIELFK